MDFKRLNNWTGWAVFAIALVTYFMTMAPTASFWDCGEFIACANELEVPHPPGAPFYLLLGRVFAMFAFNDVSQIAWMLNLMSVLTSAFTVLFTFWITTHLAAKMVGTDSKAYTFPQILAILGAGTVAGLANTYADSFWFNAVEAEVYAMSSFFTAIVVWLMFKWEERADEAGNHRWLILIAYIMGLSIGVHLLNLLTIPALAFIYYFRKYPFSWKGFFITSGVSIAILGVIQTGIILYTFDFAWAFERFLTSMSSVSGKDIGGLGLPIGSGVILFFTLLFGALGYAIYWSQKNNRVLLNTSLLSVLVIYIGFSSYMMIPVRSQANPPIDENNPENTQSFLSYMKREQYGSRPLLKGPLYNAQPVALDDDGTEYMLSEDGSTYVELGQKRKYRYAEKDQKFFPRMYDNTRPLSWDPRQGGYTYANFVKRTGTADTPYDDQPSKGEDLMYFFQYQIGHMYLRYFLWNFVGKESDVQNAGHESGLEFSKIAAMPDFIKSHPSKNHFYYLPLLLGLLGLFWHSSKKGNDAIVVGLLFFFTGLAIIIYLNQYPNQPRERDYSFAGSFQTFAIWIGLGVLALYQLLEQYLKQASAYLAVGVGLVAPLLMAVQGWDDHSRANNYVAPDSAYNLLNSLEKDAILFTNGDNDTFPLWYLQEVENIRPDVRVLCLSYVNTDWYIDQMYMKMNESSILPLTIARNDYVGQNNQSKGYGDRATLSRSLPADAQQLLAQGIISEEDLPYVQNPMTWSVSTRGPQSNRYLELKDELILNLLDNVAKSGWSRPVYFANTVAPNSYLGLQEYFRQEGLAYRVLPVKKPSLRDPYDPAPGYVHQELMHKHLVEDFRFQNLNLEGQYYDENIYRMLDNYYTTFYRLANNYLLEVEAMKTQNQALAAVSSDSAMKVIEANNARIPLLLEKSKEVMLHAETSFPVQTIDPNPYLVTRFGIVFKKLQNAYKDSDPTVAAEMGQLADRYFDFLENKIVGTLAYYSTAPGARDDLQLYTASFGLLANIYGQFQLTERTARLQEAQAGFDPRLFSR